jgi:F420-dependent oxidoreductase-like protein
VLARKEPVRHDGREISLPYPGPGALGVGKPLTSILHSNPRLPIWLGTGTEANVKLTAEVADGWLPLGFVPSTMKLVRPWLEEGFRRAGHGKSMKDLEIQARTQVTITDDVGAALRELKPRIALYVGGMGARGRNFYTDIARRYGYEAAAKTIQDLYLGGRKAEAEAAVPDELVDEVALCGPRERIRERLAEWKGSGVTTIMVVGDAAAVRTMAELAL